MDSQPEIGSIDRIWSLIGRLDNGEELTRDDRRSLRKMARRWMTIFRRLRNKQMLARLQIKLRKHGMM